MGFPAALQLSGRFKGALEVPEVLQQRLNVEARVRADWQHARLPARKPAGGRE